MSAGGTDALQTLSVVTAFPLIFILSLVAASLVRWLREDDRYRSGATGPAPGPGAAEPGLGPDQGKEPGLDTPPSPPAAAAR
jgi:BCCT family betaine/carnitine transporter